MNQGDIPRYDIFSGYIEQSVVRLEMWFDSAESFETACEKMQEQSRRKPGHYFVLSLTNEVLASIDSRSSNQPATVKSLPVHGRDIAKNE
jgi:hypothetical protein